MALIVDALERRIPDVVSTLDLPDSLAAEIDFLAARTEHWAHSSSVHPAVRARALVSTGDPIVARAALAELDVSRLTSGEAIIAAWATSRVGPAALADSLREHLSKETQQFVSEPVPYGPTSLAVGQMHAVVGDLAASAATLRSAVGVGDGRGPLWGALARLELARVLRCTQAVGPAPVGFDVGDEARAAMAARTFLVAGGYRALMRRAHDDLEGNEDRGPALGLMRPGSRWTIGFGLEASVEMRASKGLSAVHYLIGHRDRPVAAAEIARFLAGDAVAGFRDNVHTHAMVADDIARSRVTKLVRRTIDKLADVHRLLGEHLMASISTGYACRYTPAGPRGVTWQLDPR